MDEYHTLVDRNYMIWYASTNPALDHEDIAILDRNNIKSSLLEDAPLWLQKWAALVLRYCELESKLVLKPIKEQNKMFTDAQCEMEAKNILSTRINNIAITIDKIKHCLNMMDTNDPPLRTLTYREVFNKYNESINSFN